MPIWGRLKSLWRALDGREANVDNQKAALGNSGLAAISYVDGHPTNTPQTQSHSWAYENIPWVMACVRAIAQAGASVPLQVRRVADDEPLEEGELQRLFSYVNERQDGQMLIQHTLSSLALHGNAIWHLSRGNSRSRTPLAIYPLRPELCSIISHDGDVEGYMYMRDSANPEVYPAEDIFHCRNYSPTSDMWGMADLEALEVTVNTDRQAALTNYNFLLNGATPSHAILAKGSLTEDQRKQLRDGWTQLQSGAKNAGRVVTLSGTEFEIIPLGTTPREAQYLELRKLNREEICAAFQVPPSIVGIFEYANYANSREQRRQFWSDTIKPRLSLLQSAINEQSALFNFDSDREYVDFDLSDVEALQPEYTTMAQAGSLLIGSGQWTVDEVREKLWSMPPKQVDEEPPQSPQDAPEAPPEDEEEETPAEDAEKLTLPPLWRKQAKDEDEREARRKSTWEAQQAFQQPWIERMGEIVSEVYRDLADEVIANIEADLAKGYKATEPPLDTILFSVDEAGKVLAQRLVPEEFEAYLAAGRHVIDLFNLGIDWEADSSTAQAFYAQKDLLVRTLPETYHEQIRGTIMNVLENGEPLQSAIDAIETMYQEQYGDANTPGAKRIAETEMCGAYNIASEDAYEEAGVEYHEWLHSFAAAHPRETHIAAHGEVVKIGEPFSNGLMYPHDPAADAEETINCGCTTAPIIDPDEKPETPPVPEGYGDTGGRS